MWPARRPGAASPRTVAPAVISNIFLRVMMTSIGGLTLPPEGGASRFLSTRFHAHLIFRLARRPRIILHAGALLITAHFAARLLSLTCFAALITTNEHEEAYRQDSHGKTSSPNVSSFSSACSRSCRARRAVPWRASRNR